MPAAVGLADERAFGHGSREELASDEVYGLDYFLDKFIAWAGYQIVGAPDSGAAPSGKISADLERAAKVVGDRLRDIDALHQLVRDRDDKK